MPNLIHRIAARFSRLQQDPRQSNARRGFHMSTIEALENRRMLDSDPIVISTPSYSYQTIADFSAGIPTSDRVTNGSEVSGFNRFGNKLFFAANDELYGNEIWSSDGTAVGTQILLDINPGSDSSIGASPNFSFLVWGNRFVFTADDGVHGRELWISDGTAEGT